MTREVLFISKKTKKKTKKNNSILEFKIDYLCKNWQYFIQQILYLANRGYYYFHVVNLPIAKQDKWEQIDCKLINKYHINKSKFQRSRQKAKGIANFYYYRCSSVAVILHTEGKIDEKFNYDDKFEDMRKNKKLIINVSEDIQLEVSLNKDKSTKEHNSYTIRFTDKCLSSIMIHLEIVVKRKNKANIIKEFNRLNGIPAYSGIVKQRVKLGKWLVGCCKHHQVSLQYEELDIDTFRKVAENK